MARARKALSLGLAVGLIGGAVLLAPFGQSLEEHLGLDWLFSMRGPLPPPDEAVVVAMDRPTIEWLRDLPEDRAQWPAALAACLPPDLRAERLRDTRRVADWPRQLHACAVDALAAAGAAAIVYDMAFVEQREEAEDRAFAEAIARAGRVALLQPIERVSIPGAGGRSAAHYDVLVSPIEVLARAAAALAPFPLPQDTARLSKFWLFKESVGDRPTLPVVALQLQARAALRAFAAKADPGGAAGEAALDELVDRFRRELAASDEPAAGQLVRILGTGGRGVDPEIAIRLARLAEVLTGERERYLNFYGAAGTIRAVPFHRLLSAPDPSSLDLTGKVAFVGVSDPNAAEHPDRVYTVFRRADAVDLSGVEVAASGYANLASGLALRRPEPWAQLALALALGLAAAFAALRARLASSVAVTGVLAGLYLAAAHVAFARTVWLPVAVPLLLQLPLALLAGRLMQHRAALLWLQRYVPRPLARRFGAAVGLADCEATVMFTDIARFTSLSERSAPAEIARFLSGHLAMLAACVEREGGIVDKYIGDGLMAFWTAAEHGSRHAEHACRAARAIAEAVRADNDRRRAAGQPAIGLRIGVHSGRATVGDIGGAGRLDYTIVGDTVNLAQRVEQLCKEVAGVGEVAILVSETTAAALDGRIETRPAGRHRVRGRDAPLDVYTLA